MISPFILDLIFCGFAYAALTYCTFVLWSKPNKNTNNGNGGYYSEFSPTIDLPPGISLPPKGDSQYDERFRKIQDQGIVTKEVI